MPKLTISIFAAVLCAVACVSNPVTESADTTVPTTATAYVTGEKGVYAIDLDTATGALSSRGLLVELEKTRFLTTHPTKDVLYVARMEGEHKTGAKGKATAFAIDPVTRGLSLLNEAETGGRNSAHIEVSRSGSLVAIASFHGSTVSSLLVKIDGSLSDFVDKESISDPGSGVYPLQSEPRPHAVRFSPDDRFAYVPDLGTDTIYIFEADVSSGILEPASEHKLKLPAGSGSRHFDFHPTKPFAYVLNELSADITVFDRDEVNGALTPKQVISMLPEDYDGRKWGAEVRVHPSGKFLFASNRAHDSIAVFQVDQDNGTLALVELEPTLGETPRHFTLDPSGQWLVVGNQYSSTVTSFAIDQDTGELDHSGSLIELPSPNSIAFFE